MNREPHNSTAHLREEDLIRYLDAEMAGDERGRAAEHLIVCRACSATLDSLRSEKVKFSELLAELPVQPLEASRRARSLAAVERAAGGGAGVATPSIVRPVRRLQRSGLLRAAAVATVLIVSGLATSPVRAWVADAWREITGTTERIASGDPVEHQPEVVPFNEATIGFVPTSESFVLEIENTQAAGSLILGVAEGSSVTAHAVGEPGAAEVVVLPNGMLIRNAPDARADYAIRLPSRLAEVRVKIGDSPELVYRMDMLESTWVSVLSLAGAAPGSAGARSSGP